MPGDLQTKLEKYERKAAQYEKAAEQANDGPERALYEGLASYCDELAEKFRQVIAKRTGLLRPPSRPVRCCVGLPDGGHSASLPQVSPLFDTLEFERSPKRPARAWEYP